MTNVIQFPRSQPHGGLRLTRSQVQPPVGHLDRAQRGEVEVHGPEDVDALARGQEWQP